MIIGITIQDINSFCKKLGLDPEHLIIMAPSHNIVGFEYTLDKTIFVFYIAYVHSCFIDGYTLDQFLNWHKYFFEEDDKQFIIENLAKFMQKV